MYYVNVLCLFSSVWFGAGAKVEPEVEFPLHKTPIPAPDLSLIGLISIYPRSLLLENLPMENQTKEKEQQSCLIFTIFKILIPEPELIGLISI